ncbi:MAG TPA: hypothetical protein VGH19_24115 [Verrucomicrobiae bacterium]
MKTNDKNDREGLHIRSLLVSLNGAFNDDAFLSKKISGKQSLNGSSNEWFGYVKIKALVREGMVELGGKDVVRKGKNLFSIPPHLEKRVLKGDHCIFEPIIAKFKLNDGFAFLVCTPFPAVFNEIFKGSAPSFFRNDLRKVCDDQFSAVGDGNAKVVRLHCKLGGDKGERISSLTCIGKNVVTSAVMRDILSFDAKKGARATPFGPGALAHGVVKRDLDPVSCRIKWDDGTENGVSLNMDRYGNFSFYLKQYDAISEFYPLLRYLSDVGAIVSSNINPVLRSDEALHEVDSR